MLLCHTSCWSRSGYFWYKTSEGGFERRDEGTPLAAVDAALSCASLRSADWIAANRAQWPPALRDAVLKYADGVPQKPIVRALELEVSLWLCAANVHNFL